MNNPEAEVKAFNGSYRVGQLVSWNDALFETASIAFIAKSTNIPVVALCGHLQYVPLKLLKPVLTVEGLIKKGD